MSKRTTPYEAIDWKVLIEQSQPKLENATDAARKRLKKLIYNFVNDNIVASIELDIITNLLLKDTDVSHLNSETRQTLKYAYATKLDITPKEFEELERVSLYDKIIYGRLLSAHEARVGERVLFVDEKDGHPDEEYLQKQLDGYFEALGLPKNEASLNFIESDRERIRYSFVQLYQDLTKLTELRSKNPALTLGV